MMTVEVTAHEHAQAGAGATAGLLGDLQRHGVGRDDIVAADDAFLLDAEDLVEVDAGEGHEGGGGLRGRAAELGIEGGHEVVA